MARDCRKLLLLPRAFLCIRLGRAPVASGIALLAIYSAGLGVPFVLAAAFTSRLLNLAEPDPKPMAHCIALDMDCADICRLAVGYMSRGSAHAHAVCQLCADICDACADVCSKHPMDHCGECVDACRRCADECRRMPQHQVSQRTQASAGRRAH